MSLNRNRLGAFIVATLAILVVGVFIIGSKQYLFSSTYQLKARFDNVVGLDAGGDVRVGGVHSGTVRNIVLPHKPGEKVTVVHLAGFNRRTRRDQHEMHQNSRGSGMKPTEINHGAAPKRNAATS